MNILLVQPTPPSDAWPRGLFRSHSVPLGLAHLAGELQRAGHVVQVELREATLEKNGGDLAAADTAFLETLRTFRPGLIGFSATSPLIPEANRLATVARETLGEDVLLLLGGPHATALGEQCLLECAAFDAACIGEGEQTIVEVASGGLSREVAGLVLRKGDELVRTPPSAFQREPDQIAPPAWDLFDMDYHTTANPWMVRWLNLRTINLRTSRGCPNVCTFCAGHLTAGPGVRYHSIDYVAEQIQRAIDDWKIEAIIFEDETIGSNEAHLLALCDRFCREGWNKKVKWAACLRVDQARPDLLAAMKNAGCIQIEYGFESGSDAMLQVLSKNSSREQNLAAVALTREAGLRIFANVLFGLPGETKEDVQKTLQFIRETRCEVVSPAVLNPYPGTPIYTHLADDMKASIRWDDYAYADRPGFEINLTAMDDQEFFELYNRTQKYFLSPLIARQILRDAGGATTAYTPALKKRARRFAWHHPLQAARLPLAPRN